MVLREPFMVKTFTGTAKAAIELLADTGESFLIKEIGARSYTVEFAEALIDRMSAGWWMIGKTDGLNHLDHCEEAKAFPNLMSYLGKLGLFRGYPVAEGQKFSFRHVGENIEWGRIIYEKYDAGDMLKTMPNGTEATEFDFVNYGSNTDAITENEWGELDYPLNPAEYPNFPYGAAVPADTEVDIHGVLFPDWYGRIDQTAANHTWLKFSKGREVLFDEDRQGIFSSQGMGYFTYHTRQTPRTFIPFPKPYTFRGGEEMKIEMYAYGGNVTAKDAIIAMVETVRKV